MSLTPSLLLHGLLIGCCIIGGMLTTHVLYSVKADKTARMLLQCLIVLLLLQTALLLVILSIPGSQLIPLRAILAALLPPWVVMVIGHINRPHSWHWSDGKYLLPALLALIVQNVLPGFWLDSLLIGVSLVSGLAVIALSQQAHTEVGVKIQQSVGLLLLSLGAMDAGIAIELNLGKSLVESVWLNGAVVLLFAAVITAFLLSLKHPDWLDRCTNALDLTSKMAPPDAFDHQLVAKFEQHLSEHPLFLSAGLTVSEAAEALGVSKRQLSQTLNRTHDRTFSALMNDKRIQTVKSRLVAEPDTAITTLMYECGFNTKSSFHREFSSRVGCSPSEFRQRHSSASKPST